MTREFDLGRAGAALAFVASAALFVCTPASAHDDLVPTIERLRARPGAAADPTASPAVRAAALVARGELERLAGEFDRAAADYDAASLLDPHGAGVPLCRAALAFDARQFARAESLAAEASSVRPEDARAWRLRASSRRALGRPREALADLDRAIACPGPLRPDDAIERARLALELDGPAEALAGLESACMRTPDSAPLLLEAVSLETRLGRTDEALARIDALLARCDRCAELHSRKGDVLAAAGRELEAQAEWTEALSAIDALGPGARPAEKALAARLRAVLEAHS